MSEPSAEPAVADQPTDESPLSILGNLLTAPSEAFGAILRRPTFLIPLTLSICLSVLFTAVWTRKVDFPQMQKTQLTEMGMWERMPPEAREQVANSKPGVSVWLGAILATPILSLLLGGFFLLIYRFFYGGDLNFKKSFSILSWVWAITGLVATPLMLLVFYLKDDWNIPPDQILQANLTLLLDKESVHKVLWSLAKSIDAFTLWTIFLLTTGFGIAAKKPFGSAVWGVVIPWLIVVAIKMGFAAIF